MRKLAICALLFTTVILGREQTDVIVMQNGDRITGEIKGLQSGVLRVEIAYVDGAVSVQWSKVARIESRQLFIVKTEDGSVYTGVLGTEAGSPQRPMTLEIAGGAQPIEIERSQVVQVEELSRSFLRQLSGSVDL